MVHNLLNKYVLMTGAFITPILTLISTTFKNHGLLIILLGLSVFIDTTLGIYIGVRKGKFSSTLFWKIGDKLISYFSLIVLAYLLFIVLSLYEPLIPRGLNSEKLIYLVYFSYSAMFAREAFSIMEAIDVLQPDLLPKWFKKIISSIFNKKPNILE